MVKEVKLIALQKIKGSTSTRRLVGQSQIPPNLFPEYTDHNSYLSGCRLASERGEIIRTGPQTSIQFRRLPVRPERQQGQTHPRALTDPYSKDPRTTGWTDLSGLAADVPHRSVESHQKTSTPRSTAYEAHSVAPAKEPEGPIVTRKGYTPSQVFLSSSEMGARGKQCASRSTTTTY